MPKLLTTEDKWIVSTLNTVAKEVKENLEKLELGIAVQKVYDFIWEEFCYWYIELLSRQDFQVTVRTLRMQDRYFFTRLIKFSDFSIRLCRTSQKKSGYILYQGETVMLAKYPEYNAELDYPEASDGNEKNYGCNPCNP